MLPLSPDAKESRARTLNPTLSSENFVRNLKITEIVLSLSPYGVPSQGPYGPPLLALVPSKGFEAVDSPRGRAGRCGELFGLPGQRPRGSPHSIVSNGFQGFRSEF